MKKGDTTRYNKRISKQLNAHTFYNLDEMYKFLEHYTLTISDITRNGQYSFVIIK